MATEAGTPQGAVASPLLANIYLHYVFDLWAESWRQREASGDMIIVRYADDIVVGFQHSEWVILHYAIEKEPHLVCIPHEVALDIGKHQLFFTYLIQQIGNRGGTC